MEKHEDERKDDCGDKADRSDEATTSKAVLNDPSQKAYNVNDLKAIEFNSADDVRQAMKTLLNDSQGREDVDSGPMKQQVEAKTDVKINDNDKIDNEKVVINVGKVTKDRIALEKKKMSIRKRPGRPPMPGPSKRPKKTRTFNFYAGKLSNLMGMNQKNKYAKTSDNDSILSF